MNAVLDRLRADHVNFRKVHDVIAHQAELAAGGGAADLEALAEAVSYLADYPAHHHHPIEDVVCERLKRARPAAVSTVDGILREHQEIGPLLVHFWNLIAAVRNGANVSRADFVSAANAVVKTEREHLARENAEIFPAALAVLGPDDWRHVQERAGRPHDPLFEAGAGFARLRPLLAEAAAHPPAAPSGSKNPRT